MKLKQDRLRQHQKVAKGLTAAGGLLVLGIGALAGGEVWALTGSLRAGGLSGAAVVAILAGGIYGLRRRYHRLGFLGEVRQEIAEEEFTRQEREARHLREKVQQQGQISPARVAGSIRQMLAKKVPGSGKRRFISKEKP